MTTTAPTPPRSETGDPVIARPWAAGAGLLGVASALAAGDLVAGLLDPPSSPFLAVGNQFIRMTPEWLKQFAIATFGTYDKVALLGGMAVVIALAGVVAGLASRRTPTPGQGVIIAMGVLAAVAATLAPTFGVLDLVPAVAAPAVGYGVFTVLHRALLAWAAAPGQHAAPEGTGLARRRALTLAGVALAGTALAGALGRLLAGSGTDAVPDTVVPPAAAPPPPRIPAGADFAASGTPSFLTPNDSFYRIDTALQVPRVGAASWSVRIHGMVEREVTLTFDQLRSRRLIEKPITMTCVSNPVGGDLASTALFLGVPLVDLLMEAGVQPGAEQVFSTSVDGFTTGTPVTALTDTGRDAMLAIGMNGKALPVEHGFPVRMVVPGLYGYVSGCKWITDMEVTTWDANPSFWELRGWSREAPIKTQSRIDVPRSEATVPAGRVVVAGTAWAQHTGITRVEVRADGGRWQSAELATEVGIDTWRMWQAPVDLAPGRHQLQVRATDRSGYLQTAQLQDVIPDGATGWHTISVTAA
ncbi:molybdopterin-dependent oxidoreductase [Pseudonocardia endophytica]|uniref:DMSO/TMAO reductase YedYZ molybdopterin-dependent catalytic subunit n=1 Tax=Pseudonocardia endophytica TaxID=401976 RepID=A0A4R1HUS3_PSEEN|nr:molybdopterin-dependent oxidoreductase [Pseudonocardia endophytica]TCK25161.1 DMSO/TMAO reductase YedYZ molybdopterin-dependent catalytic subunit [Pseudonocardia endophytica]